MNIPLPPENNKSFDAESFGGSSFGFGGGFGSGFLQSSSSSFCDNKELNNVELNKGLPAGSVDFQPFISATVQQVSGDKVEKPDGTATLGVDDKGKSAIGAFSPPPISKKAYSEDDIEMKEVEIGLKEIKKTEIKSNPKKINTKLNNNNVELKQIDSRKKSKSKIMIVVIVLIIIFLFPSFVDSFDKKKQNDNFNKLVEEGNEKATISANNLQQAKPTQPATISNSTEKNEIKKEQISSNESNSLTYMDKIEYETYQENSLSYYTKVMEILDNNVIDIYLEINYNDSASARCRIDIPTYNELEGSGILPFVFTFMIDENGNKYCVDVKLRDNWKQLMEEIK